MRVACLLKAAVPEHSVRKAAATCDYSALRVVLSVNPRSLTQQGKGFEDFMQDLC